MGGVIRHCSAHAINHYVFFFFFSISGCCLFTCARHDLYLFIIVLSIYASNSRSFIQLFIPPFPLLINYSFAQSVWEFMRPLLRGVPVRIPCIIRPTRRSRYPLHYLSCLCRHTSFPTAPFYNRPNLSSFYKKTELRASWSSSPPHTCAITHVL